MSPSQSDYSSDRRLDILVLGPMGDAGNEPTTIKLQSALNALLLEDELQALLLQHHILTRKVHVPEGQSQPEIVHNILTLLDSADLTVFDLTHKEGNPDRANVFYELGLVHSLGIPALLVIKDGHDVPFYAETTTQYRVADFELATLAKALRAPLREFLDLDNRTTSFTNDRVSQFYGLPIVDISAAVGIATGYYYNFISRLITEGGFISSYPDLIKHFVYVRPTSVNSTYEADMALFKASLLREGLELKTEKLSAIAADDKGPIWFDHVNGVVVEVPRNVYPLRRSPRLLSLLSRQQQFASPAAERTFHQRLYQVEQTLLIRVEAAIKYQMTHDGPRVRSKIVHFTTMDAAAALVKSLAGG